MKITTFIIIILLFYNIHTTAKINISGYVPYGITNVGLQKEYHRIQSIIQPSGNSNQKPIDIIFYSSKESKQLGVRIPEWGGGGALGQDSILIPVDKNYAFYPDDYFRITLHELVHIALARAYKNSRIPRWFNEGLAMTLSGELSFDESVLLSRAIATRSLISFDSIESVNQFNRHRARIAYSESHFAIQYMTKLYGYDMIPELLDSAKNVRKFDTACVKVFGLTTKEFELIVKNEMTIKYRYIFLFTDYSFLWLLVVLLAMVGFILTIIRNNKRHRALALEDEVLEEENKLNSHYVNNDGDGLY